MHNFLFSLSRFPFLALCPDSVSGISFTIAFVIPTLTNVLLFLDLKDIH